MKLEDRPRMLQKLIVKELGMDPGHLVGSLPGETTVGAFMVPPLGDSEAGFSDAIVKILNS